MRYYSMYLKLWSFTHKIDLGKEKVTCMYQYFYILGYLTWKCGGKLLKSLSTKKEWVQIPFKWGIPLPTFTYDSFPKPTTSPPKSAILGRFTKWKIIFSNSFWTKYWGCSWFWISIKSYYCYKSGSRGPLHLL